MKLVDQICKYEMDPASVVNDTERIRFCSQRDRWTGGETDGQTDRQMDKVKPVYAHSNKKVDRSDRIFLSLQFVVHSLL